MTIQMNLGSPQPGRLTDDNVRELFSVSDSFLIALLGTDNHNLVRLRRKANNAGEPVDPARPLHIVRNAFGTPVEVWNQ